MSALHALLIIGLVMLAVGLCLKWREKKVTLRNVRGKLRDWLDAFELSARKITPAQSHFGWEVRLPSGLIVWLLRTHARDRFIGFLASIPIPKKELAVFNGLSDDAKAEYSRTLLLELAKARIVVYWQSFPEFVTIERMLPITQNLSEADVIDELREMDFSVGIALNTASLLLRQPIASPTLAPDTETPPISTGRLAITLEPWQLRSIYRLRNF